MPDDPLVVRTPRKIQKAELRPFIGEVSRRVMRGQTFACLITDDAELRRLNKTYRGKNSATDVLSFPAASANGFAGDIAISIDRARKHASEHGHATHDELRILILHGALHLRGMDHETDEGQMARAEARWRKTFGLPQSLLERNREPNK